jgi:hypothetical protein
MTPFEIGIKGELNVMRGSGQLPESVKPFVVAISQKGGEIGQPGMNKNWAAEIIGNHFDIKSSFRRRLLAEGVVISYGVASALRKIDVRRGAGFPLLRLDPIAGWLKIGTLAGPKGKLL